MLALTLALAVLAAAPHHKAHVKHAGKRAAAAAPDSADPVALLTEREKEVHWKAATVLRTDVTLDGVSDAVVLGTSGDGAFVAIVSGPLSTGSKHWVLPFPRGGLGHSEASLCGDPERVSISLEKLNPPIETAGCDVPDPAPECAALVKLAKQIADAAKNGSQGINLKPGPCESFHIYFDPEQKKPEFWRL